MILAGIFRLIFATNGPANELIASIGVDKPVNWLTDDLWFIFVIVVTDIWKGVGIGAIIYLASIAAIPVELYRAAKIAKEKREDLINQVKDIMETVHLKYKNFSVPLTVDFGFGENWGQAH